MLAVVPGESDELIQDPPLLGRRARLIPLGHGDHQLLPGSCADRRHRASFGSKNSEATMSTPVTFFTRQCAGENNCR